MASPTPSSKPLPPFTSLPLDKSGPPGNAWGLFGPDDQLGRLNLLTPAAVRDAARDEIREGVRVSLDWDLDQPAMPAFARKTFEQRIVRKEGRVENDDVVAFNTQSGSQWDGLRHFGYQRAGHFYNGKTQKDFEGSDNVNGIGIWSHHGGITGRGVLLDWATWAARTRSPALDPSSPALQFSNAAIPLSDLRAVAAAQGIASFRPGDILFLRVGYHIAYARLTPEQRLDVAKPFDARMRASSLAPTPTPTPPQDGTGAGDGGGEGGEPNPGFLGLEATPESLRWLWESQFAAVASDAIAFEQAPIDGPLSVHAASPDFNMHQWCLAGWGLPIGELFWLEDLADTCQRLGRWSFFVSSMPLKVPGGVASPPNAVAIF
ncbi:hypothetical protein F5Y15DRAFT_167350 [Xylariaceae sp. FL0016]|nr:hypothetical protein F5Y15DRAFT_167350 [Xylariaceae sp. FL0016]